MDETKISKEKMESLRALAETNVKIGEAKNTLLKIKEEEATYLEEREKKATLRIEKIVQESKEIIDTAYKNYKEIQGLLNTVTLFNDFLSEAYDSFSILVKTFDEKNVLLENKISLQEKEIEKQKQNIENDKIRILNDKASIENKNILLEKDRKKITDDRGTLERAINRLKENRI